jgi:hypothetical protein
MAAAFGAASKCYTWIYGIGGHGKTVLLRSLYRARIARAGCGIFVDPTARNGDLGTVVQRVKEIPAALKGGRPFSLVYQSAVGDDENELWPMVSRIGHLLLAVDEVAEWGASDSVSKPFLELVRKGRNQWVDIATTCQAPTDLHPRIRQQADVVCSFKQGMPAYARTMEENFFRQPGMAGLLLTLPRLTYLRSTLAGGFSDVSRGVVKPPG